MDKILTSESLIRFSDCDPLGHLNNMRFLDYFLNAREDHLIKYANFNIYDHAKSKGRIWVMFQSQITYLKPVFHSNYVTITSRIIHITEKSIHVEMQMRDKKTDELKAVLWMIAVYIDIAQNKSVTHEEEVNTMLENFYNPVSQKTFEERVRYLQGKN